MAEPPGKPQAVFMIELWPGQVVDDVRLIESSGNKALDDAMERAIRKSSPLPAPPRPEAFERKLRFVFKLRPE
jgi:colicin import membrane protein